MGRSVSVNYSREKGRYGGFVGSIQIHTVPGIGINNDPKTAVFRDNLPGGFLRCDGTVKNVKDFYALAQVLGIGDECRFKKENTILRNPDPDVNDLGSFQLPDLGSKVIIASRATGEYTNTTIESRPNVNRVGVEVTASSNVGERAEVSYVGNLRVSPQTDIDMLGTVKFNLDRKTSATPLSIEEFQAHFHDSNQATLNYTGNHAVDGMGKGSDIFGANSGAGNVFEETSLNIDNGEPHAHAIARPTVYSPSVPFTYGFNEFDVSMENVTSYIDIDVEKIDHLNQVVTPFILVEYVIKF